MIVEDMPDVRRVITETLEDAGHAVTPAIDGSEALSVLMEQKNADGFDVALIDVKMPGIAALDVVKKIKSLFPKTLVMIIPSMLTDIQGDELRAAGADAILDKPFKGSELLRAIAALREVV